jgi:hypothetical protein
VRPQRVDRVLHVVPVDPLTAAPPAYGTPPADYVVTFDAYNATVWSTSTVAILPANVVDLEAFRQIAKWLWSPLLGFVGGLVALRLSHRREHHDRRTPAAG